MSQGSGAASGSDPELVRVLCDDMTCGIMLEVVHYSSCPGEWRRG